jgi:hypothetical protein
VSRNIPQTDSSIPPFVDERFVVTCYADTQSLTTGGYLVEGLVTSGKYSVEGCCIAAQVAIFLGIPSEVANRTLAYEPLE